MERKPRIEIINLGDELLNGIRLNGHLTYLGEKFAERGLTIASASIIRDRPNDVRPEFCRAWDAADIIITTGGLGPTTDDLTREAIAEALGLSLEYHSSVETSIRERFERLGHPVTKNNLKQCYALSGAKILPNRQGTAPGQYLTRDGKHLFMLPGPVTELHPMFEEQVLPILETLGFADPDQAYIQLRTVGVGESKLEMLLQPHFAQYPGLGIGYCAHRGVVDLRLSIGTASMNRIQLEDLAETCRDELGEDFLCYGDLSLAQVVYDNLRSTDKSFSTAESCTGGLLSSSFTDVPGASKFFAGGSVCYNNDAKIQTLDIPEEILIQHGAVSRECALAMVTGAAERFGTDYALSITGFAGPGGGSQDNPVGTIYIGYFSPSGIWSHKEVFAGSRESIKERAVIAALDFMRRRLHSARVEDFMATELD